MARRLRNIMALVLALSLAFAAFGCGKTDDASQTSPTDSAGGGEAGTNEPTDGGGEAGDPAENADAGAVYNLGVQKWGAGVPILDSFGEAVEWCVTTLGSTCSVASDDFTADKELKNAQNFISQGVDGLLIQLSAGPVLLQIAKEAAANKIPLATYITIGDDPDIQALADEPNPYWVGACDSDMVLDGQLVAQYALADGCTKAVIIGGNIGDNSQDQRANGFTEAFEAGGGTVLSVARCTDNSEAPQKAEDMLAANPDADCLYAMVGDYVEGSLLAIDNLSRADKIKMYMSCVDATSAQYMLEGKIVGGNDGISLGAYISTAMMFNFLDGHPIKTPDGKAPRFSAKPVKVDASNAEQYLSVFYSADNSIKPIPETALRSLLWRDNPDVSYQTYIDMIDNLSTLDYMLDINGLN
ncbi:MAG: substrate-binding domain-containing protein [Oscillospiraceae bacterium]|jgi:ribose transport system substrate-binding protein|nr:substrate-binding domain-containing protein [Oscillospiraceae bacterium]